MDRHNRVHRFRRILRIVQRHLDGRTGPVRREALRIRRRVGIPLHLHLVDRGIGLHARGRFFRGVAGDLLICVLVQMMDRHNRVHRFRRARRIVQRHLDRRTRSIHGKGVGGGIRIGISLHRLLIGGRAVGFGGQLLPGIAGDLLSGHLIEMMERNRGIDHLRLALLHLKHHGIGAGGAIGVERHKHLAGADELVARRYQRGIRRKAAPLCRHRIVKAVNFVARKAVGDMHRAAGGADRLIRRHGNHGQIQRIGDFKGAVAPYLDIDGRNAVHRRGIAIDRRADGRRIRHHRGVLHSGDTADGHAGLQRLFRHGSPIDHLIAIEGSRNGSALHAPIRQRRPLQRYGRQHADILRQSGHGQHQLRRDEQHAGDKRQHPPESSGNMLCHIDILLRCN